MGTNTRFFAILVVVLVAVACAWLAAHWSTDPRQDHPRGPLVEHQDTPQPTPEAGAPPAATPTVTSPKPPRTDPVGERAPSGPTKRGVGTVKGRVWQGREENLVAGAEITIELQDAAWDAFPPQRGERWQAISDDNGEFEVERLPEFDYAKQLPLHFLVWGASGDLCGETGFQLHDDEPTAYVSVELRLTGAIAGTVQDANGSPVVGAWVFPNESRTGSVSEYMATPRARTNAEGRFELRNLYTGRWTLCARAEGYAPRISDPVETGDADVVLVLSRGGEIAGIVVDGPSGVPLPGLGIVAQNYAMPHIAPAKATSAADGRFAFRALAAGAYTLVLDDPKRLLSGESPTVMIEDGARAEEVRLVTVIGGTVTGRVYDADTGEPIPNVRLRSRDAGNRTALSDSDGRYRLTGLPSGSNVIGRERARGYPTAMVYEFNNVDVRLGEEIGGVDFPIKRGLYLRGRVVDPKGFPIENAVVSSSAMNESQEGESTVTRADGAFEHRGFSPDTFVTMHASKEGYQTATLESLHITDTDLNDIEIVLGLGAVVEGTVVDPTGAPLPKVIVRAAPTDKLYESEESVYTHSRDDGSFTFSGLAAGAYWISLGGSLKERPAIPVELRERQHLTGLRIVDAAARDLTISGQVISFTHKPVVGARIEACNQDGWFIQADTLSDNEGRFRLEGLTAGVRYEVTASHPSASEVARADAKAGRQSLVLHLPGSCVVAGRVIDALRRDPLTSFEVAFVPLSEDVAHLHAPYRFASCFDAGGRFHLEGVRPGPVTLVVRAPGYIPTMKGVGEVAEDRPIHDVTVLMAAGCVLEGVARDAAGAPVAGARLAVLTTHEADTYRQVGASDGAGAFRLDTLDPEVTVLAVSHPGYTTTFMPLRLNPHGPTRVEARLFRGGIVRGTVRVAGQPPESAEVTILPDSEAPIAKFPALPGDDTRIQTLPRFVDTDEAGRFVAERLPAGTVQVVVEAQSPTMQSFADVRTALVQEGRETVVDFSF